MIFAAHSNASPGEIAVLIGIVVVLGILGSAAQSRNREHRGRDMAALAARLNFDSFEAVYNVDFAKGWGFLSALDRGTDRYAFNLMQGKYHECKLFVFDYHYRTGDDRNSSEHYLTILMLVCNEAFPHLSIGREHLAGRIVSAIGLENDIKFESAEFSKVYAVRSDDKKFAYDVCNARMIEYLLANRDLRVELQGPAILLAFQPQLPVTQIEFNLQRLAQIRSLLPEYLFTKA